MISVVQVAGGKTRAIPLICDGLGLPARLAASVTKAKAKTRIEEVMPAIDAFWKKDPIKCEKMITEMLQSTMKMRNRPVEV